MSISLIKKRFYKPENQETNTRGYHQAIRATKFFAPVVTHFRVSSLLLAFQINHYCPLGCITLTFLSFYNSHVTNKVRLLMDFRGANLVEMRFVHHSCTPCARLHFSVFGVLVRQARSQQGSTSSSCIDIQQVGGVMFSSPGDIDYMTCYMTIHLG
jgi:hypothetical protein